MHTNKLDTLVSYRSLHKLACNHNYYELLLFEHTPRLAIMADHIMAVPE